MGMISKMYVRKREEAKFVKSTIHHKIGYLTNRFMIRTNKHA